MVARLNLDIEDRSSDYFRNVSKYLPDYMSSRHKDLRSQNVINFKLYLASNKTRKEICVLRKTEEVMIIIF
jgi:hypothetical protein